MSSMGYEVEVMVSSASNLKNVNWRNGALRPYAVVWVDDGGPKCSTRVGVAVDNGEEDPVSWQWDQEETLLVPVPPGTRLDDAVLRVDVVHAAASDEVVLEDKPAALLVGSARLPLRDVLDEAGLGGGAVSRTLGLKRPSGRPQGRLHLQLRVRDQQQEQRYDGGDAFYPAPGDRAGGVPYYYGQEEGAPSYGQPTYAAPPAGVPGGGRRRSWIRRLWSSTPVDVRRRVA